MKPTSDKVQEALGLLTSHELQVRFYSGLTNPDWFEPLEERGTFKVEQRYDGTEQASWPPFLYLVNIAVELPEAVTGVLTDVDSPSPFIRRDLVQALLKLPSASITRVARKAPWLRHPAAGGALYADLLQVVDRLCAIGDVAQARNLARRILQLRAEPAPPTYELEILDRPRAVSEIGEAAFKGALDRATDAIFASDSIAALEVVADLLDQAQTIEARGGAMRDLSYVWMENLASSEPPPRYDPKMDLAWRFATLAHQ